MGQVLQLQEFSHLKDKPKDVPKDPLEKLFGAPRDLNPHQVIHLSKYHMMHKRKLCDSYVKVNRKLSKTSSNYQKEKLTAEIEDITKELDRRGVQYMIDPKGGLHVMADPNDPSWD
jgi:hypothetical protein